MNISPVAPWVDDITGILNEDDAEHARLQEIPLVTKDDPLALSWASYHVWKKSPGRRWVPLTEVEAHDHDRQIADVTRRYYRDKLAMRALRGGEPTKFQRDLYDICNNGVMRQKHLGMIYRLPYFYEEDVNRETLRGDIKHQPSKKDFTPMYISDKQTWELHSDRKIFCSRRSAEIMEYWFRNEQGHAVMWPVRLGDAFQDMVEGIFNRPGGRTAIHAYYRPAWDLRLDLNYWRVHLPEFAFNGQPR